jgi:hypothetical protein
LVISAEPSAEGFYKRMGAIKIGQGPFFFSPDLSSLICCMSFIARPDLRETSRCTRETCRGSSSRHVPI